MWLDLSLAWCLLLAQAPAQDALALIQAGNLEEARARLAASLRQYPRDAMLHNLMGVVEARQGNFRKAEMSFLAAVSAAPNSVPVYLNLGRLYQEHLDKEPVALEQAIGVYRKIVELEPASAEGNYQLAYLLLRKGEYEASLQTLDRLNPQARKAAQTVAVALADQAALGHSAEAGRLAEELTGHPRFAAADVTGILPALEAARQHKLARKLLEAAVRVNGVDSPLLTALARSAYAARDYEGAMSYLAHARDLDPGNAGIHFFFGMTAVALDLPLEAKKSLSEAVRLAPGHPYYQYALGAVLAQDRDASQAIPHFEQYCQIMPDDPRGKFALAVAYFLSSQYESAQARFATLARVRETAAGARYFLGRIAKQQNRLEDAERDLTESLKLLGDQPDARAELAQVYIRMRRYPEAEKQLRLSLERDADHYMANLILLTLYQRLKDPRADEQSRRLEEIKKKRTAKEQTLWRTIEVRPY